MVDHELTFQKIHDAYRSKVYRYMVRMVGEADAEDVTQEAFTRISQSLSTFRGKSSISTWIYKISTNVALDRIRKKTRRRADHKASTLDAVEENQIDGNVWTGEISHTSEQQIIHTEMNGCIRNVISKLPESYRTVIILSELEGFRDKEIAEIFGLSLQATKIRLHRARARLKEELAHYCILYRDERNELACDLKESFRDFRKEFFS